MYRHDLAYLSEGACYTLLDSTLPATIHQCIHDMIQRRQPFIVCRQTFAPSLNLATSCLIASQKYRVAVKVEPSTATITSPLCLSEILPTLSSVLRPAFQHFLLRCDELGARIYVYGSFSHQYFTQLTFIHAKSDIDLLIIPTHNQMLIAILVAIEQLQHELSGLLKVDGEIRLADKDIAFSELSACLRGSIPTILVKTLTDTRLESTLALLGWTPHEIDIAQQQLC